MTYINTAHLDDTHLAWLKTHVPQGTHFIDTAQYYIPGAQKLTATPRTPAALLHLIHDLSTQLEWAAGHPQTPSAPAFFTPDDIIQVAPYNPQPQPPTTPRTYFMISPEKFLPIVANKYIRLCNIPPSKTPFVPPEITHIPTNIPPQTVYYSLGHLAETFTPQHVILPQEIGDKMRRFIAQACAPNPDNRQLLWE